MHLDYSISSGPFLTVNFEFDQDHRPRPGPKLECGCSLFVKFTPYLNHSNIPTHLHGHKKQAIEAKSILQSLTINSKTGLVQPPVPLKLLCFCAHK